MDKLKCVFFATPEIALPTLKDLIDSSQIELKLVVSMPDRPAGRGKRLKSPPVIELCKELNIDFLQSENINKSQEFQDWLAHNKIDFFLVFAFAQFIGQDLLSTPKLGCFNIHTSLLPKYRGAAPMQYALFNGDKETGITIQKMVKKMDAGDIVLKSEIDIDEEDNLGSLHDKLSLLAPKVTTKFIDLLKSGDLKCKPQNEKEVSFSPSIPKSDTLLDFKGTDAVSIHNKVRGLSPMPAAYCFLNKKRLKVFETEISHTKLEPGQLSTELNSLIVGTKTGSIRLKDVQLEGKSRCSDFQLLNGLKNHKEPLFIKTQKEPS